MGIGGAGLPPYLFALVNAGSMMAGQNQSKAVAEHTAGIALFRRPGTHLLSSDRNVPMNIWTDACELERALSAMLSDGLRQPLEFRMALDLGVGLAASLRRQISLLASELRQPDGLATNLVALTSLTDLIMQTPLLALPHNDPSQPSSR